MSTTDTPTDGELLRAADHDPHAFRVLYERWAKPLLGFCYRRTGDAEASLDEELVDAAQWRSALNEALAQLTTAERDAVRLRVIEQLDYPTVAAQLRCSEQAARARVHRGLTRLAATLEAT